MFSCSLASFYLLLSAIYIDRRFSGQAMDAGKDGGDDADEDDNDVKQRRQTFLFMCFSAAAAYAIDFRDPQTSTSTHIVHN